MSLIEGAVIGAIYFAGFLGLLLAAAGVVRLIGAERLARWLHLPTGEDL